MQRTSPRHRVTTIALAAVFVLAVAGTCDAARAVTVTSSRAANPTATITPAAAYPPEPTPIPGTITVIALAKNRLTPLFRSASDKTPFATLDNRRNYSGQEVFTVVSAQGSGYIVHVPIRPNATLAYVRATDVSIAKHAFLIEVSLSRKELVAYDGTTELVRTKAAIGQSRYPTPKGVFFTREFYRPKTAETPFGVGAFGLSGYSNVLTQFGRGNGQIAIHGTNHPELVGQAVSHGCIRVDNAVISRLYGVLPPGVPVVISD